MRLIERVGLGFAGWLALSGAVFAEARVEVVTKNDVTLQPLNPLRGDASPKAGVLWGDITRDVSTGTLIQFNGGFSSPPHIHNITYRAVVIEGVVHNDDPTATYMWMGPGSFWTQPAGEDHITAAGENGATAFLEILSGPYLVQPSADQFDNRERPINMEAGNVLWLDGSDVTWIQEQDVDAGASIAFLWGSHVDNERNGTFVRMPSGYSGQIDTGGTEFRAVAIKGAVTHSAGDLSPEALLEAGSYFGSEGQVIHNVVCDSETECQLYVHSVGKYSIASLR